MRTRGLFIAAAVLLVPVAGRGTDAPHDPSTIANATGCQDCHMLHFATGTALTNQPDIFTVCTHCHNNKGASFTFGGKWYSSDQATSGAGGHSHHWVGSTSNSTYGASAPTDAGLKQFSSGGNVQCSTCHDPHAGASSNAPLSRHVSIPTGSPQAQTGGTASGASLTLAVGSAAVPKGYRILVGPALNQFKVSHNAQLAATAGTPTYGAPYTIGAANTAIPLSQAGDDPAVSVSFSALPTAAGGYWDFYVGFPFLRLAAGEGQLCVNCHATRNQAHADVETSSTYGWASGKPFSHPVGEALGANGKGYDLATPLDVNGATQGSASKDSNPTNDLALSPAGNVTCVSCHAAHNADSNSQTVDAR